MARPDRSTPRRAYANAGFARPRVRPAFGDLQGGVVGALVESLASCVEWLAVRSERKLVMGLSGRRS